MQAAMPELQLGAALRWGAEPAAPAYPGVAHSAWPLSIKKYQVGLRVWLGLGLNV
jgi:hypothetical protein